ncbi:MAG: hypothetical protein JWM92_527 [Candidatus Nomurabacteria bacterium]|nr:hypothetical protein [Candidatus Nomurabacteria bacterium]
MKNFSSILLRIAIAAVFIWFGIQQLIDPTSWVGFLPTWVNTLPISQTVFIYLNGVFELIFGTALLLGFYSRIAALLLGLHLLGITQTVGYSAIGVRDFGLALSALSIAASGPSPFSLDMAFRKDEPVVTTTYTPTSYTPTRPIQSPEPVVEHKVI